MKSEHTLSVIFFQIMCTFSLPSMPYFSRKILSGIYFFEDWKSNPKIPILNLELLAAPKYFHFAIYIKSDFAVKFTL